MILNYIELFAGLNRNLQVEDVDKDPTKSSVLIKLLVMLDYRGDFTEPTGLVLGAEEGQEEIM